MIFGVLNIDVELLLPRIGEGVFKFCGNVFDFSLGGESIFGASGIKERLELRMGFFEGNLTLILEVELFSLLDEIDVVRGEYILS